MVVGYWSSHRTPYCGIPLTFLRRYIRRSPHLRRDLLSSYVHIQEKSTCRCKLSIYNQVVCNMIYYDLEFVSLISLALNYSFLEVIEGILFCNSWRLFLIVTFDMPAASAKYLWVLLSSPYCKYAR